MEGIIDKHSRIPYYDQLASILRNYIEGKDELAGEQALPSENELVKKFQVSRATVRQALALLEREGLIYKTKGKGTYIAKNRVRYPLTEFMPTTQDMKRRGWKSGIKVLKFEEIETRPPFTEALELESDEVVYELCRLRLGNDIPVGIQWAYLPKKICPGLINLDLTLSLVQTMETHFGVIFWSANEILKARLPTEFEAQNLNIEMDLPVIYMERQTYSFEGEPVEFLQSVWRSDLYEYEFSLSRKKA
jgi:GntR family transcriptional regulator